MARTSYVTQSQVSVPSAWTGELVANIEGVVGVVKGDGEGPGGGIEGKKYVRNFLDKCARCVSRGCMLLLGIGLISLL
jgi:hypothetical protein